MLAKILIQFALFALTLASPIKGSDDTTPTPDPKPDPSALDVILSIVAVIIGLILYVYHIAAISKRIFLCLPSFSFPSSVIKSNANVNPVVFPHNS